MNAPPPWVFVVYPFAALGLALLVGRAIRYGLGPDDLDAAERNLPAAPRAGFPARAPSPGRGRQHMDERAADARLYDRSRFGVRAEPRS